MAVSGPALYYWSLAAVAAGTVVQADADIKQSEERQRILAQELKTTELAALAEENVRLSALALANSDVIANAGGVDAYASASLTAVRQFNFRVTNESIADLRLNLATSRAGTSAQIRILKSNNKAVQTAGIFEVAGTIFGGFGKASMLKAPAIAEKSEGLV